MEPDSDKSRCCVLTSYLDVSDLYITDEGDVVVLIGVYGDINTGEFEPVTVETSFTTFYELLPEAYPSDRLLAAIENRIAAPSTENELIKITDEGDTLCFADHIFSLGIILEEDDLGNLTLPEENDYMLQAYIKRQDLLPEFLSYKIPTGKTALSLYNNRLCAMRYQFYLRIQKTIGPQIALMLTLLTDPLVFSKAKAAYDLGREGWALGG